MNKEEDSKVKKPEKRNKKELERKKNKKSN